MHEDQQKDLWKSGTTPIVYYTSYKTYFLMNDDWGIAKGCILSYIVRRNAAGKGTKP